MTKAETDRAAITPEHLSQQIEALGTNVTDLAGALGVSRNAIYGWQAGTAPVPLWLSEHLALRLGLIRLVGENPSNGDIFKENVHIEGISATISPNMKPCEISHTMQPPDLHKALESLGLKQSEFGRLVGVTNNTVSRWSTGSSPIPAWVPVHLSLLLEVRALYVRFVQP